MATAVSRSQDVLADDFRAVFRSMASDTNKTISSVLHDTFDRYLVIDIADNKSYLYLEKFELVCMSIKKFRNKFNKEDLQDIFDEIGPSSTSGKTTIDELIDFCQRTISKARILAMKARANIIQQFRGNEGDYRRLFSSLCIQDSNFAEKEPFVDFIEDMLECNISDNDGLALYSLFDVDGDGKVSIDDFLTFIMGQTPEAARALELQNTQSIVDIKISINAAQDAEFLRIGYEQLLPTDEVLKALNNGASAAATQGTFGKKESLWIWRKKNGNASGRLRPIVDIQLDSSATSSALVLSGYTSLSQQIAGQYLWIKRAFLYEDEAEAIIELYVTIGMKKNPGDRIWSSPGVGWIRVDGNFAKSRFGGLDGFLWFKPLRTRSVDAHTVSPIHAAAGISEDTRVFRMIAAVRNAIRTYIPLDCMKLVKPIDAAAVSSTPEDNPRTVHDFSKLFNTYDKSKSGFLSSSQFSTLLIDIGIRLDSSDVNCVCAFFDVSSNSRISRDEFAFTISLTPYEIDLVTEQIRNKLLLSAYRSSMAKSTNIETESARTVPNVQAILNIGAIVAPIVQSMSSSGQARIRESKTLSQVFKLINTNGDGILSLSELMSFVCDKLEIYLTEEEALQVIRAIDLDGDEKIEETDFIAFMKRTNGSKDITVKKAQRLQHNVGMLRRWLLRGMSLKPQTANSNDVLSERQWLEVKARHDFVMKSKFPGFWSPIDIVFIMMRLGVNLTFLEASEILLLVSPDRAGRIHHDDLFKFLKSSCRSFGELLAILSKEPAYFKNICDCYRKYRDSYRIDGFDDKFMSEQYQKMLQDMTKLIQGNEKPSINNKAKEVSSSKDDIVSISQIKNNFEAYSKNNADTSLSAASCLTLEEWAALVCLTAADVADDDSHGAKLRDFIDNLVKIIVNGGVNVTNSNAQPMTYDILDEKSSLELLCKDLQRLIYEEAKLSAKGNSSQPKGGKKNAKSSRPDYHAAFQLFDEDGKGTISTEEFRSMLTRLQLIDNVSEYMLTLLLAKFDKNKKGFITYEDFLSFVDNHKDLLDDEEWNDMEGDKEDDLALYGLSSPNPPSAITRNAECDWLIWYIWRQACRVEPSDPESVITELESSCAEMEEVSQSKGTVSSDDLWELLHELKLLSGAFSKSQYDVGIKYLLMDGQSVNSYYEEASPSKDVDYEALCRYTIRMGRAFNAMVQEQIKKDDITYKELRSALLSDLMEDMRSMETVLGEGGVQAAPKYEKIFRRLDTDGDGHITMEEFKVALKKLRHKSESKWDKRMIRRLFQELDQDNNGSVSVKEITSFLREGESGKVSDLNTTSRSSKLRESKVLKGNNNESLLTGHYEDDEDDNLFVKQKTLSDSELYRKINQILQDLVPMDPKSNPSGHIETVRNAIRRFFHRSDPDNRGVVSEERFRTFLRKSSLLDRLTAGEIRKISEKVRRKKLLDRTINGSSKDSGKFMIDYERFLRLVTNVQVSHPLNKAEIVAQRLQVAINESAASGRPFLGLCSLVDTNLTGFITTSELIHTAKMMGCILSKEDIEALTEVLPRLSFGQKDPYSNEEVFDYKELQYSLVNYQSKYSQSTDFDFEATMQRSNKFGSTAFSNTFDKTRSVNLGRQINSIDDIDRSLGVGVIETPLGLTLTDNARSSINPLLSTSRRNSQDRGGMVGLIKGNMAVYDRILRGIADRIAAAVDDLSERQASSYNLLYQFEYFDSRRDGLIYVRDFQSILSELGVDLSASDLHALQSSCGRPEDNRLDYVAFLDLYLPQHLVKTSTMPLNKSLSRSQGSSRRQELPSIESDLFKQSEVKQISYSHPRVLERWKILQGEGENPRQAFAKYDYSHSGMIDVRKFRDVIQRLQLLRTQYQLSKAIDDFKCIGDDNMIMYEDFCYAIEVLLDDPVDSIKRPANNYRSVDGDNFDGVLPPTSNHRSNQSQRPAQQPDEEERWKEAYNNLERFRSSQGFRKSEKSSSSRGYPINLDEDNDSPYHSRRMESNSSKLNPPKMIDSVSYKSSSPYRYNSDSESPRSSRSRPIRRSESPRNKSSKKGGGITIPRSSPSKVGSKIWGSHTSLDKKGKAPLVDDTSWCCAVCLYVENPKSSTVCLICNSPNYSIMKDFQLKEQCVSCTFLNGQFAEECEMCGEPLSTRRR